MSTVGLHSIKAVGKANGKGHRWFQLYWYALSSFSLHSSCDNPFPLPPFPALYFTRTNRPHNNEVTLSLLHCVKAVGFTANVNMLGTFLLGWRSHDLDTAYIPFVGGTASCRPIYRARGCCQSILPGCRYLCLCREWARIETSRVGLATGRRASRRVVTWGQVRFPHMGQPCILAWRQG
jgi:hypothetical protein